MTLRPSFSALLLFALPTVLLAQSEADEGTEYVANDTIFIDASTENLFLTIDSIGANKKTNGPRRASSSGNDLTALSYYDVYANLPQPPTAAAISQFVNTPVNYAYGLPEIKIPLYDMVVDDITIPIYLEYHASGIKVNEPFSPFGAGWTLHAEPSISRTVRGLPDEHYLGSLINGITSYAGNDEKREWIYKKRRDKMPDTFDYRLLDKAGSFHFNGEKHGSAVFRPFEPLQVSYTLMSAGYEIGQFTIRDENGLVYRFLREDACRTDTEEADVYVLSEWKCSDIVSTKSGRKVEFEYYADTQKNRLESSYAQVEFFESDVATSVPFSSDQYLYGLSGRYAIKTFDDVGDDVVRGVKYYNKTTGQEVTTPNFSLFDVINSQFPELPTTSTTDNLLVGTIKSGKYSITFDYAPSGYGHPKMLKSMTVWDGNTQLRKVTFYISGMKSYPLELGFYDQCKLDSIRFEGGGGLYQFAYYYPEAFPKRTSRSRDFWGYYNGQDNATLISRQQVMIDNLKNDGKTYSIIIGDANREPSLVSMQTGALKRVTYPTGGWTEFEYDMHRYSYRFEYSATNIGTEHYYGGGLRIASITDYTPGEEHHLKRTFTYYDGKCRFPPIRYNYAFAHPNEFPKVYERFHRYGSRMCDYYYHRDSGTGQTMVYNTKVCYVPGNALAEWPQRYGSPVVYPRVQEDRSDGSRTIYHYQWGDDFDQTGDELAELVDEKDGWLFGQPYLQQDYAKKGNSYELVHSTGYVYDGSYISSHNHKAIRGYDFADNARFYGDIDAAMDGSLFAKFPYCYTNDTKTGVNKLLETRDSIFDGGLAAVTVTSYKYTFNADKTDPTAFLRETKTTFPDGRWTTVTTKYPTDLTLAGSKENARQSLVGQWMVNTPLERSYSHNGISMAVANYDYSDTTVPRLTTLRFGKTAATSRERITYSNYTAYGKPMYIVTDGTKHTVLLYGYQGEAPLVVVQGATYAEVVAALSGGEAYITSLCAKESPTASDMSLLRGLKTALPAALVTVYGYKNHVGISNLYAPGVSPTSYDYDGMGRLTNIKQGGYLLEHNKYNYLNK